MSTDIRDDDIRAALHDLAASIDLVSTDDPVALVHERAAKSDTASPTFDRKVPVSRLTFSPLTSSAARRTASSGLPPSSREMTSTLRPSSPPAALASSTASCQPMR